MVDFRCQQLEDRATQGCDLSASWLPRGRCHTVSLFSVACGQKRYRWRAPEEHAINPGVKGQSPLELLLLEDCQEAGTPQ